MMRLTSSLTCALVLIATPSAAQVVVAKWRRINDQHGSSVEVPISILRLKPDPAALTFVSEDGEVKVQFSTVTESRPGFPGNDPKEDMDLKRSDCSTWPPSYYVLKEKLAAYSCVKGNKVIYYVSRYTSSGSVNLYVEYPQTDMAFWNKAVSRMSASMHQVERKEIL